MAPDLKKLLDDIKSLSVEDRQRLQQMLAAADLDKSSDAMGAVSADIRYQELLLAAGLIREIRPRSRDQATFDQYVPVAATGLPVSQTIIEERR